MPTVVVIGDHRRAQVSLVERAIASVFDAVPGAEITTTPAGLLVDFDLLTALVDFDGVTPLIDFL